MNRKFYGVRDTFPTKPVSKDWFCEMKNAKILGLASGGGQQMPILENLNLDYWEVFMFIEKIIEEMKEVFKEIPFGIEHTLKV